MAMTMDEMEKLLVQAWKEVFDTDEAEYDANFFELGGDSIKAVQLVGWLLQKGVKLDMMNIFTYPTIEELIPLLEETAPMYLPPSIINKEKAKEMRGEAAQPQVNTAQPQANTAPGQGQELCAGQGQELCAGQGQQLCTPQGQQLCTPQGQQLCTPQGQQLCTPQGQQLCTPQGQQLCTPQGQQLCTPQGQELCAPQMAQLCTPQGGQQLCTPQGQQLCTPQAAQLCSPDVLMGLFNMAAPVAQQLCTGGMAGGVAGDPAMNRRPAGVVDKPIDEPFVVEIEKPHVAKPTTTPEAALETVISGILRKPFDKNTDLFKQGLNDFAVMQIVTRCAEQGYVVGMKDVFENRTFNTLVTKLVAGGN